MRLIEVSVITITIGIILVFINLTFFAEIPMIFTMLNLAAVIIAVGIPLMYRYDYYNRVKKIERMFPRFLSDVTKNINTGMTLPQAMRAVCTIDYDILTPYVKEMSAKISWGITFEKVLVDFSRKVGSKSMKRTVWTIIEAHRSGGTINTVLEAVSESLRAVEKIKKERSSSIHAQMVTGYLIYIVFLSVMIGLSLLLVPSLGWGNISNVESVFGDLFRNLAVMQGVFVGLVIGKMAEGTLLAGVKHSLILTTVGISAFVVFVG